jgi:pyridoxine 4-dehydrogenase
MAMSGSYGSADREEGIATIRAALDAGVTLLDTGDFYGTGHNELLISDAPAGRKREDPAPAHRPHRHLPPRPAR